MTSFVRIFAIFTYIFLFLFNGFMLLFLGNYFNYIFFAAMIVVPVGTYFSCRFLVNRIKPTITGATLVDNRMDEFVFNLEFSNPSIFFTNNCVATVTISNSFFGESVTHSINFAASPFATTSVTYPVKSSHCGIVTITINEVFVYDLLNIFALKRKLDLTREIPVFPNYNEIDEEFDMDFSQGYSDLEESQHKGSDTSEVSDIREYIPGDKLQNIHWKLSAKKDILMVKEHVSLTSSQLIFYIELANPEGNVLDLIMDSAYGIGIYLVNNQIPFSFMWYSTRNAGCCSAFIANETTLHDTIFEMLYEKPLDDYQETRRLMPVLSGHENFITIGVDYVLEKE